VTPAPRSSTGTIRDTVPLRAVEGRAVIGLPPLEQAAPLMRSACPPTPLEKRHPIESAHTANKYSPADSQIEIRAFRSGNECLLTVRDSGPGVPVDERERIFDRFYRSSLHRADRTA